MANKKLVFVPVVKREPGQGLKEAITWSEQARMRLAVIFLN